MTLSTEIDPIAGSHSEDDPLDHDRRRAIELLLDVANDPRFALRREELQTLAAAVRLGGPRASAWRGINLHAAFAADTVLRLRPRRRRRLATLLSAVATFLLVLPVWQLAGAAEQAATNYRQLLETVVAGVLVLLGARWMTRSADRADREDHDRGAARLARAMTSASITLNTPIVQSPAEGVEVLTEATMELLRAQHAAQRALMALQGATQRLDDSADQLATGIHAVGKSLGLHTGALQHQISELTQVRASLEHIAGLGLDDTPPNQ